MQPTTWRPQAPLEDKGVRIPRPQWLPLAKTLPAEVVPGYSARLEATTTLDVLTMAVKLNKTISQEEDNEDIVLDEEMLAMIARWPAVMEARQRAGGTLPPTRDQKFFYTNFCIPFYKDFSLQGWEFSFWFSCESLVFCEQKSKLAICSFPRANRSRRSLKKSNRAKSDRRHLLLKLEKQ